MNSLMLYGVVLMAVGMVGVGYGLWHMPKVWRAWRAKPPELRRKELVGTLLLAALYALLVWGLITAMWASVARGQEVPPSDYVRRWELQALEARIAGLEAALQKNANTFNPILHNGTTVEIWLDPVTGPAMTLGQDALGKIHAFIEGKLHVLSTAELEGDLTVKGNVSFDPRKSDVHFTPRTAP